MLSKRIRDLRPGDVACMYGTLVMVTGLPYDAGTDLPGEQWLRIPMIWNRLECAPPEQADTLITMADSAAWQALERTQRITCRRCGYLHDAPECPRCGTVPYPVPYPAPAAPGELPEAGSVLAWAWQQREAGSGQVPHAIALLRRQTETPHPYAVCLTAWRESRWQTGGSSFHATSAEAWQEFTARAAAGFAS